MISNAALTRRRKVASSIRRWMLFPTIAPRITAGITASADHRRGAVTRPKATYDGTMVSPAASAITSLPSSLARAATVVETPNQMDFYSALGSAEDSLQILDHSTNLPKLDRVRLKPVVRGKVVKFLPQIMGKNWLHLQDGSGSEGSNDLTVTTATTVNVGDVVLVSGVVSVDRDFGFGYEYDVILEDAEVTVE